MTGKSNFPGIAFCVAVVPPTHRFHVQSDHFFSYDSATTVEPSDQYQLQKVFFSYDCGPIPSYDFTHDAPRWSDENSSVETQGVAARYKSLASPSPFFDPNRNTAASWLKAAVGPKSAPEIRHRCQGVAARYKIACFPAPFSTPIGPRPHPGSKLQSEQTEKREG